MSAEITESRPSESRERMHPDRTIAIDVALTLEGDSCLFAGISGEISRGGVFVATYQPIPVGRRVRVQLCVLEWDVEFESCVSWRREATEACAPGIGVTFQNLDDAALDRIRRFGRLRPPLYVDDEIVIVAKGS